MQSTIELLQSARRAHRRGEQAHAAALYRRCLDGGLPVEEEFAGVFYAAGDFGQAESILDAGLARRPADTGLRFLRGLARMAAGRPRPALEDFDAVLLDEPERVPALFNRALALFLLERLDEALATMRRVCELSPGSADAWANLGILYMRQERWREAIDALEQADRLAPGRAPLLRSLGNALASAGRIEDALPLYARADALVPDDPDTLLDYGLALFKAGRPVDARRRYERAARIRPGDQTALAGLYLVAQQTGDAACAARLMDYDRLLGHGRYPASDPCDIDALRTAVLDHPELVWEPAGRSTTGGQQTAKLDLRPGSAFAGFAEAIRRFVAARLRDLGGRAELDGHPWLAGMPGEWHLQAWATVLHEGGHQTPHIHPAGWMSGVFYLDAGTSSVDGGCIVFGHPQTGSGLSRPPREHVHVPRSGELIVFPSYFFHHTLPYQGVKPRISLAFDVLPR